MVDLQKRPKLSAIIACYNDAHAIPIMHRRLTEVFKRIDVDYEILFVNDASPDNAEEVLIELTSKDNHVIAINHSRNFGSQSAFSSGMEISAGDAVILMDGDLQDPPEMIEEFYKKWREGNDVVYGVRVKREATLLMQVAYKLFYRIFHSLSYIRIPTDAGDFSLIDRKVVVNLIALPEKDRFLRGLRAWVGFKQVGVPYVRPERMFGNTTNNLRKNIWWAKKGILSFTYIPLEMMGYLALLTFVFSILLICFQVIYKIIHPEVPQGISTLIIIILFIGGIQLLCISVLGEYIGKIFEEVKNRPAFIRKSIVKGGNVVEHPSVSPLNRGNK